MPGYVVSDISHNVLSRDPLLLILPSRHYREKSANSFFTKKDTGLRFAKFHELICTEISV